MPWLDKCEKDKIFFPKETIDKLQSWICNHPNVFNSNLENDHISIKDSRTCELIKTKKSPIKITIR